MTGRGRMSRTRYRSMAGLLLPIRTSLTYYGG